MFLRLLTVRLAIVTFVLSTSHAALASSPNEEALAFINLIADNKINLSDHTAISKNCSAQRKIEIENKLQFFTESHFEPGDQFTVETTKTIKNLTAVLVHATNPNQPLKHHIFPVALIKKKDIWLPAPVIGSFANSGYGYAIETEKNTQQLEQWMSGQKELLEDEYRAYANDALTQDLLKTEQEANLSGLDTESAFYQFAEHCRNKHLMKTLVSIGATTITLDEPLPAIIKNITTGFNSESEKNPWEKLTSPDYIVQVIEKSDQSIVVAFYHIYDPSKTQVETFVTIKRDRKVYILLSKSLKYAMLPYNKRPRNRIRPQEMEQYDALTVSALLNRFPVKHSESPETLQEKITSSIKANDFTTFLSLVPRDEASYDFENNKAAALRNTGALWKDIKESGIDNMVESQIFKNDTLAYLPLQFSKQNQLGKFTTVKVWMIKNDAGWHAVDSTTLLLFKDKTLTKSALELETEFSTYKKSLEDRNKEEMLSSLVSIQLPLESDLVSEEDALSLLEKFRLALREADTVKALSLCAFTDTSEHNTVLEKLQYAIKGAGNHILYDHTLGTSSSGNWRGVSIRTESRTSSAKDHPLYLIVNTSQGARILLDIDFRYENNKGRKILNQQLWKSLKAELPESAIPHIETLTKQHDKLVKDDFEELKAMME